MESKANYTAVGIAVLILFGALIATLLWLSVGFDKKLYNTYAVYINEAVSGLNEDSAVKYNGVKVGYVSKIKLSKKDPRQVQILLSIESGTPITVSTYATLISQGITGTSFVGLAASSNVLTPLEKMPGELYPTIPAKPSLFNQFDRVLRDVSDNVNKVSVQLQKVFDTENVANFKQSLANMQTFSNVIAKNSQNINQSLQNADIFLKNMAVVSTDLKVGVRKFNGMAKEITIAGAQVNESMRAGKNTINQVSQDLVPSASLLLKRLNAIAANLEELSQSMRQNPSVIVRGSTPPESGPGE